MDLPVSSQTNSSDYYDDDDSAFLEALTTAVLPGDVVPAEEPEGTFSTQTSQELEPPPPTQPSLKRQRLEAYEERGRSAQVDKAQDDDIYGALQFGDFGEYMRRKRAKLQVQNADLEGGAGDGSKLFDGLAIYINGYTQPSVQDLRKLIVKHGGTFQPYLDRKSLATHIITCSLTATKMREFKNMKVVRPEWLVESAAQGVLLPWRDFIFTPNERSEAAQGLKIKAPNLLEGPFSPVAAPARNTTRDSIPPPVTPVKQTGKAFSNLAITPENKTNPAPTSDQPRKDVSKHTIRPSKPPSKQGGQQQDPTKVTSPWKPKPSTEPKKPEEAAHPVAVRVMANPEWRKTHTSAAPDFIEGYYKNSRLHHLSTWKAELKDLVQEAQERAEAVGAAECVGRVESESETVVVETETDGVSMRGAALVMRSPAGKSKGKGKEKAVDDRVIMHCDFDAFFVSAGLLSRPHLKGKPVVVCHSQGGAVGSTSEIASCSYEARSFGIRNGMQRLSSLRQARDLCPGVITIPYEFETYKQLSLKFYTILMSHADDLQAVSVDEALIDVTSVVTQMRSRSSQDPTAVDPAKDIAETIRAQVRKATGCEVSIGISHNILLARLATRHAKPAGSYHLVPEEVANFLAPLTVSDLHGFGSSAKQKAQEKLGTAILGELMDKSRATLCDALGKATGETLYNALRGIDDKKLESDKPRKSVSCDINYGIRFENAEQAEAFIYQMATEVARRLDDIGMVGRSITLKIMKRAPNAPVEAPKFMGHGQCDLYNKQISLIGPGGRATSDEKVIGEHAYRMLRSFNFDPKELRGIGIQIQKLEKPSSGGGTVQQAMLPFQRVPSPKKPAPPPQISLHPPSDDALEPVKQESPVKPPAALDLPSFSQVDMEVFNALPDDVRKELETEYQRRSTSPYVAGPPPVAARLAAPARKDIFPQKKIMVKGVNARRIVRQQRPRTTRPAISPAKYPLFKKKARAGAVKMSDDALRKLDIDPEVFRGLPPAVQHEQLTMLRLLKQHGGKLPSPPTQRKILKPKKRKPIPPHLLWRAPPPRARFVAPPILRQQVKEKETGKKAKLLFTETGDIQTAIEGWVNRYRHWAPKDGDVAFFTKYLVACVDASQHGDTGVERAVAILKWWLVLLRRHWGGSEFVEDDEDYRDTSDEDPVGMAWWKTFREVKEKMDVVAREKFGGKLSLR
ncbi:putative impB/mucB/samB family protein [Lyophyllum shimeji]|uniref:DNA repair protein REV1 n=1 Tax=Lyophyllum shimeji TaxID=47721 RepID=A0A9P3PHF1_LYOSH|nr:putative impB/mucB/samB family protein [Lyophyllum shimeji]